MRFALGFLNGFAGVLVFVAGCGQTAPGDAANPQEEADKGGASAMNVSMLQSNGDGCNEVTVSTPGGGCSSVLDQKQAAFMACKAQGLELSVKEVVGSCADSLEAEYTKGDCCPPVPQVPAPTPQAATCIRVSASRDGQCAPLQALKDRIAEVCGMQSRELMNDTTTGSCAVQGEVVEVKGECCLTASPPPPKPNPSPLCSTIQATAPDGACIDSNLGIDPKSLAYATCKDQGKAFDSISGYGPACGKGGFESITARCCPFETLNNCIGGGGVYLGSNACMTEAQWEQSGHFFCAPNNDHVFYYMDEVSQGCFANGAYQCCPI